MRCFAMNNHPEWPSPGRLPNTRGYRRRRAKGYPQIQVALAIYPEDREQLHYLGEFVAQRLDYQITPVEPEDKCLVAVLDLIAKDEWRAVAQVEFFIKRKLPRSVALKRVMFDTRRVPDQPLAEHYERGSW